MRDNELHDRIQGLAARVGRLRGQAESGEVSPDELTLLERDIDRAGALLTVLSRPEAAPLRPAMINLIAELNTLQTILRRSRDELRENLLAGDAHRQAMQAYTRPTPAS